MGLSGFERRLEQMVEGLFSRAFRSGLQPVELGRRLIRVMEAERTLDVNGKPIAPNRFVIRLSPEDHDRFASISDALVRELSAAAREHAVEERLGLLGRIDVGLEVDQRLRTGRFSIDPTFADSATVGPPTARLVLPDGGEVRLGEAPVRIGRLPSCTVVLDDANASRIHAEVRPAGASHTVVDLGSTNGTRVNGVPVRSRSLADGDEITIGSTVLRYVVR